MLSEYPDVLTIREAMEILGVSKNTIYELVRNDTIHAFRLGAKIWRINKSGLIDYLNNQ